MGNFCIPVEGDRNHLEKEIQDSIYWKEKKKKKWGQLMLRKIVWNKQMISGIFCYSGLSPREACMKLKSHQPLPVFLICKRQIWLLNQHLMLRWWGKFMDVWLYFTVSIRITTGKCIKPLNHLPAWRNKGSLASGHNEFLWELLTLGTQCFQNWNSEAGHAWRLCSNSSPIVTFQTWLDAKSVSFIIMK